MIDARRDAGGRQPGNRSDRDLAECKKEYKSLHKMRGDFPAPYKSLHNLHILDTRMQKML